MQVIFRGLTDLPDHPGRSKYITWTLSNRKSSAFYEIWATFVESAAGAPASEF